jgi:hypothetical protein
VGLGVRFDGQFLVIKVSVYIEGCCLLGFYAVWFDSVHIGVRPETGTKERKKNN